MLVLLALLYRIESVCLYHSAPSAIEDEVFSSPETSHLGYVIGRISCQEAGPGHDCIWSCSAALFVDGMRGMRAVT
jgi:hypothetical protein